MSAQRDLAGKISVLSQFKEPDTDADAHLSLHAGALDYYNGDHESFLDKWSNVIFLAPMVLGALASMRGHRLEVHPV